MRCPQSEASGVGRAACAGFTLVELVMVIIVTGVIAGMVAVFIKSPVDSYVDTARRVALTDVADTALRRIGRDIRLALPNSARVPAAQCIEFIPTKTGGRYRAALTKLGAGDILDFTADASPTFDASFEMLWSYSASNVPANQRIVAGDIVVVYNDGYVGDAYTGNNAIQVAGVGSGPTTGTTLISFVDSSTAAAPFQRKKFPPPSPSNRFQVIPAAEHVVAYVCSGNKLYRYARKLSATYPAAGACPTVPAATPVLADNVVTLTGETGCTFTYEKPGSGTGAGRFGIVTLALTLTQSGESVKLYEQIHVDNTP